MRTHALVLLIFGLIVAVSLWLAFGSYARTETARGILVTDRPSAKIFAIRPGQVTALAVREGDYVRQGQRIATIRTEQEDEAGDSAIAVSIAAIEGQRALATEQELSARHRADSERARLAATVAGLRRQRADLTAQIALQEQTAASAGELFERVQSLRESGFISRIEIEQRRQAFLSARQGLAQLHQQLNSLISEEAQATAQIARAAADAESEVATARSSGESLVQQRAQLSGERAYAVIAPISGRVAAVQTALGRTAETSVPLMEIVPDGSTLHADIYAPTRAIGFVRPGQEVRLLYDAFPYQRFGSFGGRIARVSRTVIDPRQLAAPLDIQEAVYRIEVTPETQGIDAFGRREPLQPGMTLTANIILDRRSFLDWLLEPLNAVMRRSR
ncbi:HlyD family efflux transporter periplasmic adaptor subunit [Sphingosinicella ginsenosidimutans]